MLVHKTIVYSCAEAGLMCELLGLTVLGQSYCLGLGNIEFKKKVVSNLN